MAKKNIITSTPIGENSIKGGIFYGNNLIPSGVFDNIPKNYTNGQIPIELDQKIKLTLEAINNQLNQTAKKGGTSSFTDSTAQTFLNQFNKLLIDYSDLRNFVFYGSSYTLAAYNINYLSKNYPYSALIARSQQNYTITDATNQNPIRITLNANTEGQLFERDKVVIQNVGGLLNANGTYYIGNISYGPNSTVFSIFEDYELTLGVIGNGTLPGSGAYSGGGLLQKINFEVEFLLDDNESIIYFNSYDILDNGSNNLSFKEDGVTKWTTILNPASEEESYIGYDIVDSNENKLPIIETQLPIGNPITRINNVNPCRVFFRDSFEGLANTNGVIISNATNPELNGLKYVDNVTPVRNIRINSIKNNGGYSYNVRTFSAHGFPPTLGYVIYIKEALGLNYSFKKGIRATITSIVAPNEIVIQIDNDVTGNWVPITGGFEEPTGHLVEPGSFDLYNSFDGVTLSNPVVISGSAILSGEIKRFPLDYSPGYKMSLKVKGIFSRTYYDYNDPNGPFLGDAFKISPRTEKTTLFNVNLNPFQQGLLAKNISAAWPRGYLTDNIISEGGIFDQWIEGADTLFSKGDPENEGVYGDLNAELNIARAITLDDTDTNLIIRKFIPGQILEELYDPDGYFRRYLLITGWFFDQIKLYIDFLKYSHTLNYGQFNQLSPEFYSLYAEHYGLGYSPDNNDYLQSIVLTVPGLAYDNQGIPSLSDFANSKTLEDLYNEQQKLLLINLFSLYQKKGTLACLEQLVSLLGAPKNFIRLAEYSFSINDRDEYGYASSYSDPTKSYTGVRKLDNEKVYTPKQFFEIDYNYLVDKTNINNPINLPYVYKLRLENEETHNLREMTLHLDPNGALDSSIIDWGNEKYKFISFEKNAFCSLQNELEDHYLLPLTGPNRYWGIQSTLMIPNNGMKNTIVNDKSEIKIHIGSLFKTTAVSTSNNVPDLKPAGISHVHPTILNSLRGSGKIIFTDHTLLPTDIDVEIDGNTIPTVSWQGSLEATIKLLVKTINEEGTCIARYKIIGDTIEVYLEESIASTSILPIIITAPDYTFTKEDISGGQTTFSSEYVIATIEGDDIVIRYNVKNETNLTVQSRTALLENIIGPTGIIPIGIISQITLLYRPLGVELYVNQQYVKTALWKEVTGGYDAYDFPKELINSQNSLVLPDAHFAPPTNETPDTPHWWDFIIGKPRGIEVYFNKCSIFNQRSIDEPSILNTPLSELIEKAEVYTFDYSRKTDMSALICKGEFSQPFPIPTNTDHYPKNIDIDGFVTNLSLNLKQRYRLDLDSKIKYLENITYQIQDFFNIPEELSFNSLFRYNSYSSSLKKDYDYNTGIIDAYELFASRVVLYANLIGYLNLVEKRYKNIILQFIPIVMNMYSFGQLIRNSYFKGNKVRYLNIDKNCTAIGPETKALGSFRVDRSFKESSANLIVDGGNGTMSTATGLSSSVASLSLTTLDFVGVNGSSLGITMLDVDLTSSPTFVDLVNTTTPINLSANKIYKFETHFMFRDPNEDRYSQGSFHFKLEFSNNTNKTIYRVDEDDNIISNTYIVPYTEKNKWIKLEYYIITTGASTVTCKFQLAKDNLNAGVGHSFRLDGWTLREIKTVKIDLPFNIDSFTPAGGIWPYTSWKGTEEETAKAIADKFNTLIIDNGYALTDISAESIGDWIGISVSPGWVNNESILTSPVVIGGAAISIGIGETILNSNGTFNFLNTYSGMIIELDTPGQLFTIDQVIDKNSASVLIGSLSNYSNVSLAFGEDINTEDMSNLLITSFTINNEFYDFKGFLGGSFESAFQNNNSCVRFSESISKPPKKTISLYLHYENENQLSPYYLYFEDENLSETIIYYNNE